MQTIHHPGTEMAIFLFASLAGCIVAHRLKQSALVGQILIGVAIGPSLLGLVSYSEFVRSVAELGIIVLVFLVGLECKFREVYNFKNIVLAVFGTSLRWLFGFVVAKMFGFSNVQSIFVATAITSVSTAIVAGLLKQLSQLRSSTGKMILGSSAVDDIIGLLLLSVSVKIVESGMSIPMIASRVGVTLGFIFFFFGLGIKISKHLEDLEYWGMRNGYQHIGFLFTLMLAFLFAGVAELLGLAGIVGAFVAGLSLEHVRNKSFKIGAEYFELIFGSIFFVSLGILIDVKQIFKSPLFIIVLTLIAFIAPNIGVWFASKILKLTKKQVKVIGVSFIPIGEIAAITAVAALRLGVFDNMLYSSVIFVGIVTAIIAPILIKYSLGIKKYVVKEPLKFKLKREKSSLRDIWKSISSP